MGKAHFLSWLAALLPLVAGWGKDGHEAVGMTTMSALENDAASQVKHLMGGKDAVDIASWAHKVNKKYPWTQELHFQRQTDETLTKCRGCNISNCPDNRCLVKALKHFYGRLVNQPAVSIPWPSNMKLTDADCIRYLVNLIGDLHQPLHFAPSSGHFSANLTVEFRGKQMTLFEFWDSRLAEATINDAPAFWLSGWTHVARTRAEYDRDTEAWKKDGIRLFDNWATETSELLCHSVFRNPSTGKDIAEEAPGGVFRIDEQLYESWKRTMLSQILVAGARTAIVLNAILHHREATQQLHSGSAVSAVEDEDDQPKVKESPLAGRRAHAPVGSSPHQGASALMTNLGIGIIVIFTFLQVMKVWSGDAVKKANSEKLQDSGKRI